MSTSRSSFLDLSAPNRAKGRRDFLAWLGAATATAAVGCAASGADEDDVLGGGAYGSGEDAITSKPGEPSLAECRVTSRDARGPYYEPGAPYRPLLIADEDEPGVRLSIGGRILGPDCRTPLRDYVVDVWQADAEGNYYRAGTTNYRLRGKIRADAEGRYRFETILPGRYGDAAGIRPAHLHVTFWTPGGNPLVTTQLYFAGDPYLGPKDYCTASGFCNSGDPARILTLVDAARDRDAGEGLRRARSGKSATFDAIMPRT